MKKFQHEMTPAEIEGMHYSAALDSVCVINDLIAIAERSESENDAIVRNVLHLQLVLERNLLPNSDVAPINAAIELGKDIV